MSIAIVQTAIAQLVDTTNATDTATFASPVTPGNLLVAIGGGCWPGSGTPDLVLPTGFVPLANTYTESFPTGTSDNTVYLFVATMTVISGDGQSYDFNTPSGPTEYSTSYGGIIYELSGVGSVTAIATGLTPTTDSTVPQASQDIMSDIYAIDGDLTILGLSCYRPPNSTLTSELVSGWTNDAQLFSATLYGSQYYEHQSASNAIIQSELQYLGNGPILEYVLGIVTLRPTPPVGPAHILTRR